jgi:hypothetical protein
MAVKIRNGHSLMRSASVPDTIEAVVAQNTIWKNQSEAVSNRFRPLGSIVATGISRSYRAAKVPK